MTIYHQKICKNFLINELLFHHHRIGIIIPEEIEENDELKPIESDGNQIKFIKLIPSSWLALPESERKSFLLKQIDNVVCSET